jgi:hypothetical protein
MGSRAILLSLALIPLGALAQSEAELKHYANLDRQCEAAREKKLAPVRSARIEACVREQKRTREDCDNEFANYGNTHGKAGGGAIGGIFYDLPECVAATEARNRYRQ